MGCFEIGISVIVEHAQSIGIIRAFCLPVAIYNELLDMTSKNNEFKSHLM